MTKRIGIACAIAASVVSVPSAVRASCVSVDTKAGLARTRLAMPRADASVSVSPAEFTESSGASIVGLWTVTFFFGDGPDVFDRGFEQWHSDGTEFTMDVAVPPAAGNICVGVWKAIGPRTVKLHHVGWNWDASVTPAALAGTFVLDMVVTVRSNGRTFSGKYVTDSFDTNGAVIPGLHVEGVVRGTRITVDD